MERLKGTNKRSGSRTERRIRRMGFSELPDQRRTQHLLIPLLAIVTRRSSVDRKVKGGERWLNEGRIFLLPHPLALPLLPGLLNRVSQHARLPLAPKIKTVPSHQRAITKRASQRAVVLTPTRDVARGSQRGHNERRAVFFFSFFFLSRGVRAIKRHRFRVSSSRDSHARSVVTRESVHPIRRLNSGRHGRCRALLMGSCDNGYLRERGEQQHAYSCGYRERSYRGSFLITYVNESI